MRVRHLPFFFFSTPRVLVLVAALVLDLGIASLVVDLALDFESVDAFALGMVKARESRGLDCVECVDGKRKAPK